MSKSTQKGIQSIKLLEKRPLATPFGMPKEHLVYAARSPLLNSSRVG
jgi:hypothetical protein